MPKVVPATVTAASSDSSINTPGTEFSFDRGPQGPQKAYGLQRAQPHPREAGAQPLLLSESCADPRRPRRVFFRPEPRTAGREHRGRCAHGCSAPSSTGHQLQPASTLAHSLDDTASTIDPDTVYDIEKILRAEKISGKYRLWVKWAGHVDPTPEWRHDIVSQCTNRELLEEIHEAVRLCQEELRLQAGDEDDEQDEKGAKELAEQLDGQLPHAELGRGKRVRQQTERYNPYTPSWMLIDSLDAYVSELELYHIA